MKIQFTMLPALISISAQAQQPSIHFNYTYKDPSSLTQNLCNSYKGSNSNDPLLNLKYQVCSQGVTASNNLASNYARNAGTFVGCVEGFYQGVEEGFRIGNRITPILLAETDAFISALTSASSSGDPHILIGSAASEALKKAENDGTASTHDQLIKRYSAAVGMENPVINKGYEYPTNHFQGFTNGYDRDILPKQTGFNEVYSLNWVSTSSPFADRLAARKIYELQNSGVKKLCAIEPTGFTAQNSNLTSPTLWDYWKARGNYNLSQYSWQNENWAWSYYTRNQNSANDFQMYQRIAKATVTEAKTVTDTKQVEDTDSSGNRIPVMITDPNTGEQTQKKDAQGNPVWKMKTVVTGSHIEYITRPINQSERQELEGIYQNTFKTAYRGTYGPHYASKVYFNEFNDKYRSGKMYGESIGQVVASETTKRNAYDTAYQTASKLNYAIDLKTVYVKTFDQTLMVFENNPVIRLDDQSLYNDDPTLGIYRSTQRLGVNFSVSNLGEKQGSIPLSFSIRESRAAPAFFSFVTPPLKRANYDSGFMYQIPNTFKAHDTITVDLGVQNVGFVSQISRYLNTSEGISLTLRDYIEINSVKPSLHIENGAVTLDVNVTNPTRKSTADLNLVFKVEADFGRYGKDEKEAAQIGTVEGGSSRDISLNLDLIDPLVFINGEIVSGIVRVILGGNTIHEQKISISLNISRTQALIDYFDALATGRSTNSGTDSIANRISKLQSMISKELGQEIASTNILWKRAKGKRGYEHTLVTRLIERYVESKRTSRYLLNMQIAYNDLVGVLIKENIQNVRAGGGIRFSKKKNRRNFIKRFLDINPDLPEDIRDWM